MAKNKFFRREVVPLGQQVIRMQKEWPNFRPAVKSGVVSWVGQLTPTDMSDTYTVRITYHTPRRPVVEVIAPVLRALPGKPIPHRFPDGDLCLHLNEEWTANLSIAHTIIAWAALWLFFYEAWLVTGEWEGGGHEPKPRKKRNK
jgi:hypothetical protein